MSNKDYECNKYFELADGIRKILKYYGPGTIGKGCHYYTKAGYQYIAYYDWVQNIWVVTVRGEEWHFKTTEDLAKKILKLEESIGMEYVKLVEDMQDAGINVISYEPSTESDFYHFVFNFGPIGIKINQHIYTRDEGQIGDTYTTREKLIEMILQRQYDHLKPDKGVKYDSDKPRWDLVPTGVLGQLVDVLTVGAKKYSPDNWKHVEDCRNRYYAAMMRHIDSWWEGESDDPETGLHHLAHAICCAMFLIWKDDNKEGQN